MKTFESEDRLDFEDIRLMEEATDTVNLFALDLAIQAAERNSLDSMTGPDDNSLEKIVERGMNLTCIMGRMIALHTPS
jgi:hypothetical protein